MLFKEFGNKSLKTIVLVHGGGLSWWAYKSVVDLLERDYHVVTPIIDGHGEDGDNPFLSIEDSAKKLIEYIDLEHGGKVFALTGLSIGAQIVTEVISLRNDITEFAIIESALLIPIKGAATMAKINNLIFRLIKRRWFSKVQAKSMSIPKEMFDIYYNDSIRMTKQSLINITLSNGNYKVKPTLSETKAKAMIIVGEKEIGIMRLSASKLTAAIPRCKLYVAQDMRHGELSLVHPKKYIELLRTFFED
ncbi:MAG: alpha/beta hydrolase [Firmicutes bacterium HGW-Firmicutes-16]|nr:MAG: alpha/beta hydrolase [Firmicutes bacterium HGW-Firmicutes-16]